MTVAVRDERAIAGVAPARVETPRSAEDVVRVIREANVAREALVLWGGGTRIGIGDAPARYDAALDLRGVAGIVEHEPADLTVTVRAGTTMSDLAAELARHGQRWPVEVARPDVATVGGTFASAADGPSRLAYFHPRDWTIGLRAVLGDGTLTKAGGKVVKNVTGYDLTKLYSGSYGTLCAVVELTLKLTAIPDRVLTLKAELTSPEAAFAEARALAATGLPLDALAVVVGPAAARVGVPTWAGLFVRLAGPPAVVERLEREVRGRVACDETGTDIWQQIADLPLQHETSTRVATPAGDMLDVYPGGGGVLAYPGTGIAHVFDDLTPRDLSLFRNVVEAKGGALILERGDDALRAAVGTWGTPRVHPAVARALKERFDPNGVLAPARLP